MAGAALPQGAADRKLEESTRPVRKQALHTHRGQHTARYAVWSGVEMLVLFSGPCTVLCRELTSTPARAAEAVGTARQGLATRTTDARHSVWPERRQNCRWHSWRQSSRTIKESMGLGSHLYASCRATSMRAATGSVPSGTGYMNTCARGHTAHRPAVTHRHQAARRNPTTSRPATQSTARAGAQPPAQAARAARPRGRAATRAVAWVAVSEHAPFSLA